MVTTKGCVCVLDVLDSCGKVRMKTCDVIKPPAHREENVSLTSSVGGKCLSLGMQV